MEIEMGILAASRQNLGLVAVISAMAVVLVLGIAIKVSGARPLGEQAILEQIEREDSALCGKFGFAAKTPESADCMLDLSNVRQHHLELLQSHSWL